ncbi:MAG: tetratricopeptide repeat-containing diguanylate cyclase [Gemmatimonadaceae bacterium]
MAWLGALALALAPAPTPAQPAPLAARLASVQDAAAHRPAAALEALQQLRKDPLLRRDLSARLATDEVECRVLTDLDVDRAIAVADAGLALAGANPTGPAREPWLRLRACRAGMLAEAGGAAAAAGEFDALLALTAADSASPASALARLERGVVRSRTGEYERGQEDLQKACAILARTGMPRDQQLCLGHLANHYRRVGDYDEALRLLQPLRDSAQRAGETYDESIYLYGIAQTLTVLSRTAEALAAFRDVATLNARLGDTLGVSYAEFSMARIYLASNRAREAAALLERARGRVDPTADPRHLDDVDMVRAEALVALGQPAPATLILRNVEARVRARRSPPVLEHWLRAYAAAASAAGQWREAYQSLAEAQRIEDQLSAQRRSEQAARLRAQFNRARDAEELSTLRTLNEQGRQLRRTQGVALALFVVLLLAAVALVVRKVLQARRLHALASTDELTGVANRRALTIWLEEEFARTRSAGDGMAVLMIDVDHFKRVNDSRGHAMGDMVLKQLARTLQERLRDGDRLGRMGGEEFVVILPRTTEAEARGVAERMRFAVAASPLWHPQGDIAITVSIGVATAHGAEQAEAVLSRADVALYRAKAAGRDRVVVHDADAGAGATPHAARRTPPTPPAAIKSDATAA